MAIFSNLVLAVISKNEDDAGTSNPLNLTININGEDVVDKDFGSDLDEGEAGLDVTTLSTPFDSTGLTNSSIRLGIRDDNAWGPQDVLLFGQTSPLWDPIGRTVALAMETELTHWLSADSSEGHLTMPLRLVSPGSTATVIHRVLLLVRTAWEAGADTETDSPIGLQITAGGNLVLDQVIADSPQPDLEAAKTNWYLLKAAVPFTKGCPIQRRHQLAHTWR
jgi:hypothetical protein